MGIYLRPAGIIVGTCLLIVAFAWGSISYHQYRRQYFRALNINELVGTTGETKERLFTETLPSRQDIENFFFNTTIVTSHPPIGNDVRYFDNQGNFFAWHGNEIEKGRWYTYSVSLTRTYWGLSREDVAQVFCRELDDGSFTQDNCVMITGVQQLFSYYGTHEQVVGDILDLSGRQKAPFKLPITEITLSELKVRLIPEQALH